MFTGLYPYQLERSRYIEVAPFEGETLFGRLNERGYETYVIWPAGYVDDAWKYSKVFSKQSRTHNLDGIAEFDPHVKRHRNNQDDRMA